MSTRKLIAEVELTPTGNLKLDKKILPKLGTAGQLLTEYNRIQKELGYVNAMLKQSEGDIHHTQLRVEGTKTGRCAGTGGLNCQQLPKSKGYLDCLIPKEGYVFIQMDINSLEAVVVAELSECPSYLSLYNPKEYTYTQKELKELGYEVIGGELVKTTEKV